MARETILVVEDEAEIQELLRYNLAKEGYRVCLASSGEQALMAAQSESPQLVLLDLMLPGMDGLEVCRMLRRGRQTQSIPIVMLTAKGGEADIVAGLELGADDYVTKPFSPRVLLARIRAVLRRAADAAAEEAESECLCRHELQIHPGRHEVLVGEESVELTSTEFRVLWALARRPGWVLTRRQISEVVHGMDYPVADRSVDVQIVALRRKLLDAGRLIETVRGVGYRFKE
ncbi:MAG: response regulator transcription factor [Pirellulales bacterium]|nr:response regulator transcription factor [Pirellulales bacterium]